ncbi:DUF6188 family protein [Cellulomonas sp. NS3]|uniref:DUF6188 family protein n=1 Tax=Cellulomonas sp. NS3 TaxID=2973977 RepID=UPI002163F4C7|nr:DUF6188 family protein [Cellulomonas sp. NS3]
MIALEALVGCPVSRLMLDHQVALLLVDDASEGQRVSATLILEEAFELTLGPEAHLVDPDDPTTLGPTCRLLHQTISAASAADGGALDLQLGDAIALSLTPTGNYEAWELSGTGVPSVLVGPA